LTLEHPRHIRGGLDDRAEDMRAVKSWLGKLVHRGAGLTNGDASLSSRLGRLDGRVRRIERRLALTDETAY